MPVLDVDGEEGEAEYDAEGGDHHEDGVHRQVYPRQLDPGHGAVLRYLLPHYLLQTR